MQFQSSRSTLNARMYLYDTPRDTMAKDPMLQSLCSTSTWNMLQSLCPTFPIIFSCVPDLYAQHKCKYSCSLEPLIQHKTSHRSCVSGSTPNTNISCASRSMPNTKHIYTYISSTIDLRLIYKTNYHVHMQWGLRPKKIKHQYNHHEQ